MTQTRCLPAMNFQMLSNLEKFNNANYQHLNGQSSPNSNDSAFFSNDMSFCGDSIENGVKNKEDVDKFEQKPHKRASIVGLKKIHAAIEHGVINHSSHDVHQDDINDVKLTHKYSPIKEKKMVELLIRLGEIIDNDNILNVDKSQRKMFISPRPSSCSVTKTKHTLKRENSVPCSTTLKQRCDRHDFCGWRNHEPFFGVSSPPRPQTTPSTYSVDQNRKRKGGLGSIQERPQTNLHDRYFNNANNNSNYQGSTESFKFFHYNDIKLYMKQYRNNHSSGGSKTVLNFNKACDSDVLYTQGRKQLRIQDITPGLLPKSEYCPNLPHQLPDHSMMLGLQPTIPKSQGYWSNDRSRDGVGIYVRQNGTCMNKDSRKQQRTTTRNVQGYIPAPSTPPDGVTNPEYYMNAIRTLSTAEQNRIRNSINQENPSSRINRLLANAQMACVGEVQNSDQLHLNEQSSSGTECSDSNQNEDNVGPSPSKTALSTFFASASPRNSDPGEEDNDNPHYLPWVKSDVDKDVRVLHKSNSVPNNVSFEATKKSTMVRGLKSPIRLNKSPLSHSVPHLLQRYLGSKNTKRLSTRENRNGVNQHEAKIWDERQREKFEHFNNTLKKTPVHGSLSPSEQEKLGTLVLLSDKQVNTRSRPVGGAAASGTNSAIYLRETIRKSPTIAEYNSVSKPVNSTSNVNQQAPMLLVTRSTIRSETPGALRRRLSDTGRMTPHPADAKQFTKITDLLKLKSRRDGLKSSYMREITASVTKHQGGNNTVGS